MGGGDGAPRESVWVEERKPGNHTVRSMVLSQSRLFQKYEAAKNLQNFLKVSISIHISIFFRINLSKSVQGKCVDHLTCLRISV